MHPRAPDLALIFFVLTLLTACGGGGSTPVVPSAPTPAPAPAFTSTPVIAAVEGTAYTYQLAATDPAGGSITYKLTTAPTGAAISGNTVSWTPTAAQSRIANQFTATATTGGGGSATQSWTVTPDGTVRISWVDTYWDESTHTDRVFDWTLVSSYIAALVPQADGSFQTLTGAVAPDGRFEIHNVPAGYYWLRIAPRGTYWTSSSTFDFGSDFAGSPTQTTGSGTSMTTMNFSFTGLEPTQSASSMKIVTPSVTFFGGASPASGIFTQTVKLSSNIDLSQVKTAYVMQYKPASFGSIAGAVLGPSLILRDLAWTNGAINNVTGVLNQSPTPSVNLSIKGSAWGSLFEGVAPQQVTPLGTSFNLSVQPFLADRKASAGLGMTLLSPNANLIDCVFCNSTGIAFNILLYGRSCAARGPSIVAYVSPSVMNDVDFGAVQYGDPFPSTWMRYFSICQETNADITMPDSSTARFVVTNGAITAAPTAPVTPLISAVQNPTINLAIFFAPATINTTTVNLSWSKPAIGNPYGYEVEIFRLTTLQNGTQTYSSSGTLGTAKTSLTVPPGIIAPGQTYVFVITALADSRANMETSPHRSGLPIANADAISAPLTISSAAQ